MPAPVIAAGITAAPAFASMLSGNKDKKAQQANMAAQTGLATEQTALGKLLRGNSSKMFGMAAPAYNQGLEYFKTMVGGGPGALRQLMSSERGLTNQVYQGAKMNLERSGIRGGVGEQAAAQLNRDRTNQTASMVPGMRNNAAQQLLGGGAQGLASAQGFGGSAVTGLGNAGMTYASLGNTYDAQVGRNEKNWGSMGDSIGRLLLPYLLNYKGGGGQANGAGSGSSAYGNPARGGYVPSVMPRR